MRRSNITRTSSSSSSIDSNSGSNYQIPLTSSASEDHHQYVTTSSSILNSAHKNNYSNYFLHDSNSKRNIKSSSSSSSSDMSTDLQLGLSLSTNFHTSFILSSSREELASSQMRRAATTAEATGEEEKKSTCTSSNLFVKVKMEGSRICRKVDLLAHSAYPSLITTLQHMFTTPNILWAKEEQCCNHHTFTHVLTYQDQEGDWMMVGDVPWEMFLAAVKRLKITRTDSSCF